MQVFKPKLKNQKNTIGIPYALLNSNGGSGYAQTA